MSMPETVRSRAQFRPADWWSNRVRVGAALLVTIPIVVAALRIFASDFIATGDIAATELRVRDVFHHPVLLGAYSRFGWHHPGPALFWFLAPPYTVAGSHSWALPISICVLNIICVIVITLKLSRKFGTANALVGLIPLAVLLGGLGPSVLASPWNPDVVVLPFIVFLLFCIDVAEGATEAVAVALLVFTFMVQAHAGVAIPASLIFISAVVACVVVRRNWNASMRSSKHRRRTQLLLLGVTTLWAAPMLEQIRYGKRGNVALLWDFARASEMKVGFSAAARAFAADYSIRDASWRGIRAINSFSGEDSAWNSWKIPFALVVLLPLLVFAYARLAKFRAAILMLLVANLSVIIGVSQISGYAYPYLYRWFDAVVATTFALGAIAVHALLAPRLTTSMKLGASILVGVTLLAITGVNGRASYRWDPSANTRMSLVSRFSADIERHVSKSTPLEITNTGDLEAAIVKSAVLLQLEKDGYNVTAPVADEIVVGPDRVSRSPRRRILIAFQPLETSDDMAHFEEIVVVDELSAQQRNAYDEYVVQATDFYKHNDLEGLKRLGTPPADGARYYAYLSRT